MEVKEIGNQGERLFQIPILSDNYTYLLAWDGSALAIDPGEGEPIVTLLEEEGLTLKYVLVTHYHQDHTGGNSLLKEKTDCVVIGPDDPRIPCLDQPMSEGEELIFGPFSLEVLETPGHTKPHLAYFFPSLKLLFSGDLLFAGGCGRVFEGSAQEMWESLEKVLALPEETKIFCGHEYTLKNLMFAKKVEPDNPALLERIDRVERLRKEGKPTVPSTLAEEKKTNPFLRVSEKEVQNSVSLSSSNEPWEVFAALRTWKDQQK